MSERIPDLGVGIAGFGFMGRMHTYGLINIPLFYRPAPFRVRQITVCNPGERGRQAAEASGYFRRVTADFSELANDPELDVICISSPNLFHKEQLLAAIAAGKHIYCDKPVTATLDEAEEVLRAMRERRYRGKTQMALQYRFLPATMRARRLVEEGFLGRIYHYRCVYLHSSNVDPRKPLAWKADPARGGGGTLLDLGPHALDLMTWLVGDVREIMALGETCIKERPLPGGGMAPVVTDDITVMMARHAGGVVGTIEVSKVATGACDELRFEIHGERGALRFNLMEPNWLEAYDMRDEAGPLGGNRGFKRIECVQQYEKPGGGFPNPKVAVGWVRAHMHCLYGFLESIALDRAPEPDLVAGIRLQRLIEAGRAAAAAAAWVEVEQGDTAS